jgi:tyrosine-protein kinase Etk/Wzc
LKTKIEKLDFISSGSPPPNPSELLMSFRFEDFFQAVKEEYDLIVVDTPPVLAVTDASIVGRYAGTNMMVIKDGFNTPKEIELSLKRLKQNSVEVKGAILNFVSKKKVDSESYAYEYTSS